MRIRLTRAFPQPTLGKVIPAGSVIDAPPELSERLVREGRGEPAQVKAGPSDCVATAPKSKPAGKKVKRRG